MKPSTKLYHWQITQRALDTERERLAFLNGPLPKNDPQLFTPTKVKVLKSFCIGGRVVEINSVITIPAFDARSLEAIGKCEFVE